MTEAEDYGDQDPSPPAGQDHLARRRRGWAVAACAAGLYAASMLMPAVAPFNPGFSSTTYPGYDAFRVWVAVLLERKPGDLNWWVLGLAWLVNPAIWAAITLTVAGRRRAAGAAAGCGMVLALVTLPWYFSVVAGLPGYWAWVGSAGLVLAAAVGPWHGVPAEPGAAADRAGRS